MRSAIGGWVENIADIPPGRNGLAIISADVVCSSGSGGSGSGLRPGLDLAQRAGQRQRVAGDLSAAGVGLVLPRAADRHLDQRGGQRAEQHDEQGADRIAASGVAPAHRDQPGELRDEHHHAGQGRGHRRDQDVAVVDVGELMAEDALAARARRGSAGSPRCSTPRRARVAAGGERVGRHRRRDVEPGHRLTGALREARHNAVQRGLHPLVDGVGAHRPQREPVAVEVRVPVDAQRDREGDDEAGGAPQPGAGQQDQPGQCRQQGGRLQPVAQPVLLVAVHPSPFAIGRCSARWPLPATSRLRR